MPQSHAVPTRFYCEHKQSKSRVLVLLERRNHTPSLQSVLTCTSPETAEQLAEILNEVAIAGLTPGMYSHVENVCGALPDAVAASFASALTRADTGVWPVDHHAHVESYPGADDGVSPELPSREEVEPYAGETFVFGDYKFWIVQPLKVLRMAVATGWCPDPEEDRLPEDPYDLTDAAWWVSGEMERSFPGMFGSPKDAV